MAKARRLPPVHPGEILQEDLMKPLGLSINALARDLRVPVTRMSEIVNGRRSSAEAGPSGCGLLKDCELVPRGKNFSLELNPRAEAGPQGGDDRNRDGRMEGHDIKCEGVKPKNGAYRISGRQCVQKGRHVQWESVPPEEKSGTFVAWVASAEETKRMKPTDKAINKDGERVTGPQRT